MTDHPGPLLAPAGEPSDSLSTRANPRKKASTACSSCRARRSKCTGGVPCLSCISHQTECIKDENEDGRRRIAMKRRLDGLEEDRDTLTGLVTALKHGDDAKVQSILNVIRTNPSSHDLRSFLDDTSQSPEGSQNPSIELQRRYEESIQDSTARRRPRTGGIGDLINPPIQVPAKPWTDVTDDDDYVSHLMSLWFTWIYPWFHWVDGNIFIEAMQLQDLNSPLCAPYLVSIMLAEACLLDESDMRNHIYRSELRQKLLAEAKTGMEAENGKVSLTLIQAMGIQWTDLHLNGEDRMGRLVLNTQVFLAQGVSRWRGKLVNQYHNAPETLNKIDQSFQIVQWTLSSLYSFNLADYRKFHTPVPPSGTTPGFSHEMATDSTWFSYPIYKGAPVKFHPDCQFRSFTILAQLASENEQLSARREQGHWEGEHVNRLVQTLQDWPDRLPACMQLHAQAMPHVIILHTLHGWVLLVLAKQAAAADAGKASEPMIIATPPSPQREYWHRLALSQAVSIAGLMQNYARIWGTDYFPSMVLHPVSMALLTLLEDLGAEEIETAFVNLTKILHAASRKFRVGKGVLRVVKATAGDKGIRLPAEVGPIYEAHARRRSDISQPDEQSSQGKSRGLVESDEDITMGFLLEKWQDLDLDSDIE